MRYCGRKYLGRPDTLSIWEAQGKLLPGKSHGWRSLVGCSPWGRQELDMTEQLHFHFSLSCIGEGNSNPFQWRIPGTGEPDVLPSMGSHRVGHDWSDLAAAAAGGENGMTWENNIETYTSYVRQINGVSSMHDAGYPKLVLWDSLKG